MEKQATTYVTGAFLKEFTFNDGSSLINIDINVDKFIAELQKHRNEKGYAKFKITKRKEAGQYGDTHSLVLNTFVPKEKEEDSKPQAKQAKKQPIDDLPF